MLCCPIYNREILQKLGAKVGVHSRCLKSDGCFLGTVILPPDPYVFIQSGENLSARLAFPCSRESQAHSLSSALESDNSFETVLLVIRTASSICGVGVCVLGMGGIHFAGIFVLPACGDAHKSKIYYHEGTPFGGVCYHIVRKGRWNDKSIWPLQKRFFPRIDFIFRLLPARLA